MSALDKIDREKLPWLLLFFFIPLIIFSPTIAIQEYRNWFHLESRIAIAFILWDCFSRHGYASIPPGQSLRLANICPSSFLQSDWFWD